MSILKNILNVLRQKFYNMVCKQEYSPEVSAESGTDNLGNSVEEPINKLQRENNHLAPENSGLINQCEVLRISNNNLKEENRILINKNQELQDRCSSLNEELNTSKQTRIDECNRTIGKIIECIQGSEMSVLQDNDQHVSKYYYDYLIDMLLGFGVEVIEDCGVHFNPQFHKVEAIVYTDELELSGMIYKSLGLGFRRGDLCLIEQPVEVYKYKK